VLAYLHGNIKAVNIEEIAANRKKWGYNLFNDADSISGYITRKDSETTQKKMG
jgi:hypothetical protein